MATIGPVLPTIGTTDSSSGLAAWANADNITLNDGSSATAASITLGTSTVYLVGLAFDFSAIPDTDVIDGIEVTIDRGSTGDRCRDVVIRLYQDGAPVGTNKADTGVQWPASLTEKTYGSAVDTWGLSLTGADVKDAGFGIAIQCEKNVSGVGGASCDYVSITLHYSTPVTPTYAARTSISLGLGLSIS